MVQTREKLKIFGQRYHFIFSKLIFLIVERPFFHKAFFQQLMNEATNFLKSYTAL